MLHPGDSLKAVECRASRVHDVKRWMTIYSDRRYAGIL